MILKEELRKYLKLIKIMQRMPSIYVEAIEDMFGYNKQKSEELIQIFLNNTKKFDGDINLYETNMKSIGILEYVGGNLNLRGTLIESLDNLKYVGSNLWVSHSKVESPGHLEYVGGFMDIRNSPLAKICYPDYEYAIREQYGIVVGDEILY